LKWSFWDTEILALMSPAFRGESCYGGVQQDSGVGEIFSLNSKGCARSPAWKSKGEGPLLGENSGGMPPLENFYSPFRTLVWGPKCVGERGCPSQKIKFLGPI